MGFLDRFRRKEPADPSTVAFPNSTSPTRKSAPEPAPQARRRVDKIEREVLELIFASAKSSHPQEFGAVLRAEKDTIYEILIVPTVQGDRHAIMSLHLLPIDRSAVGTVHSHPSPYPIPSDADQQLFRHFGHTHIIVANPYTMRTWRAYDQDARDIVLKVV